MSTESYRKFLLSKVEAAQSRGLDYSGELNPSLFSYQRDVVRYLLKIGRGAAFLDTGLGKTLIQLEWARIVREHTRRPVIILTPLAVARQTEREAARFGIDATVASEQSDVTRAAVYITNYEKLQHFAPESFGGVVLDESSILKAFTGTTKRRLCEAFAGTPFRLACTATPAPNDYMEIGNHSEFLGVMPGPEMLSRFFINDTMNFGTYRLKGHAIKPFWQWVASWAVAMSKPSDLEYSDDGFALPELSVKRHYVKSDLTEGATDTLFRIPEMSATSVHKEKRLSARQRAERIAELVAADTKEPWLLWCETNYEADALTDVIEGACELRGDEPEKSKERKLLAFLEGNERILITKPKIAGFGLNFQHCARVGFMGLTFSYEQFYQAVRRCWRFGQKRPVQVHVVLADTERQIWSVIERKMQQHDEMKARMCRENFKHTVRSYQIKEDYNPTLPMQIPGWLRGAA